MSDAERRWLHPDLRLSYLVGSILGVRWDAATWPLAKEVLRWALAERGRVARAWFN